MEGLHCLESSVFISGEFAPMWRFLIKSSQNVAHLSILGHPQGATVCEYFINSQKRGATFCMGGSNILKNLGAIATYYVICGEKFRPAGLYNSPL